MKTFDGLAALIERFGDEDEQGWILLEERRSLADPDALIAGRFILADDEDEEEELLRIYPSFLEIHTFVAVVETEREASRTGVEDIAAGCLHYLEMDAFRE